MMSNYTTTQHPPQYLRDKVEQKLPIYASFFNKAVNKPPLFAKALYGYLLVLCFGLGMSSATAQQGVTYDYVNFYPDGSNLFNFEVLVTLGDAAENKVTSVCGNTPQGSYRATTLIDPVPGDYLQEVTAIPLSQYAVVKRGKPFTLTFNGYKSILTSTARVYIGSENEPTRLIGTYNGALGNIFQTLTPLFDKGASKAWIVIEGNVDGFNTTRLVIPFVVEGLKDKEIPVLGTTTTPQTPYMVVHAPPGDKSTSSFTKTGRNCRSFEQSQTTDKSKTGDLAIKVGMKGTLGAILMIDYEVSATFTTVNTTGNLKVTNTATETCTEVTNTFSTDGLYSNGNKTSDLFVGYGVDENYGFGESYQINPTTCQVDLKTNLVLQPIESTVREFRLTEEGIRTDMDAQQTIMDNPASTDKQKANASAQKKVWQQVLDKNNANKNNLSERLTGVNFSSGASGSTTTAEESTESSTLNVERYIEGSNSVSFIATFGASGAFGGATFNSAQRWGTTDGTTSGQKTEISYTLSDDDQGDQFQVDVYRDRQYGTPFFKLGNGSKTSCPYEGGYQLDQPSLKTVNGTDDTHITVNSTSTSSTSFQLNLCNNSNVERDYFFSLKSTSNSGGAQVLAFNQNPSTDPISVTIPAGQCTSVNVLVSRNNTNPLSFANMEFQLKSDCGDISSSIFATVNFGYVPPITLVTAGIQDQTSCLNGTLAACLVTASGGTGNYTYQWYVNATNSTTGGTAILNATTSLFNPPTNVAGDKYYYCVVNCTEGGCTSATSIAFHVVVNICPITVASAGSQDQTICPGVNPQAYSVTASGGTGNYTYQWYVNATNSTTGGTAMPNANTAGFFPPNNVVGEKYYYCVVSCAEGNCTSATSTVFHIIVSGNCGTPLSVSALNYSSLTVCNGQTIAPLTVTVTGGTGNYKYEWYSYTDDINDPNAFVNILIPNAIAASYTPPSRIGKYSYQCAVSCVEGTCGRLGSNSAAITVNNCVSTITLSAPSIATQTLCSNATSTPITVTASGGTGSFTYQWYSNTTATNVGGTLIANATSATFTPPTNVAGTLYYYCVVGCSGGGCTAVTSSVSQVTVNAAPTGSVNSPTICGSGAATLIATGGTSYKWSHSTETTPSVSVSPTATTNYTVTVTNANGCSTTLTSTVTVTSNLPITINNPTICAGATATLTASGGKNYTWSTNETSNSITVTPLSTTTYFVTATDGGGCSGTATATVTVNALPTVSVNSPKTCAGVATTLTATGGATYSWSTNATTPSVSVSPTSTTTYTVTGTDAKGCSNTANATVTVNPLPSIGVNSPTVCSGSTAILAATGGTTYTWSPSGATGNSITVNAPASATPDTYTVTGTDANGCSNTATATVRLGTTLLASVNNATICAGETAVLTATGGSNYTWSNNATTPSVSVNPTTTTSYTVTVTNGSGCSGVATATVTVKTAPTIGLNSPTVCAGTNATLIATGGSIYSWSTGASGNVITVNPMTTSGYTVTVTGSNGCTATASTVVTVNNLPNIGLNSATVCAGTNATLVATGGSTYSWSTGASGNVITVNPTTTSGYTVTVTGANGCTNTASTVVTVNALPNLNITNTAICAGTNATLTASGALSYLWNTGSTSNQIIVSPSTTTNYTVIGTDGNGCKATGTGTVVLNPSVNLSVNNPVICAGANATLFATGGTSYMWNTGTMSSVLTVNPTTSTAYSVTATNGYGCSGTATALVTVNALPKVTVPSVAICSGLNTTLLATGAVSYQWSTGATSNPIIVNPTTTTNYSVTGMDANGCSNTAVATVLVNTSPVVGVNSPTICAGTSATLTASGGTSYQWSTNATTPSVTVSPTVTTNYTVTATDANGCKGTATSTVTVSNALAASVNSPTICAGTSATLTATGGSSYKWSNNATTASITVNPIATTNYNVTVTNAAGCSKTLTSTVTVSGALVASVNSPTICAGTSATLTATGGASYKWSNNAITPSVTVSPTATTNYTVTVTNAGGCTKTLTATVTVNTSITTGTITGGSVTVCAGSNSGQLKLSNYSGTIAAWECSSNGTTWTTVPNGTTSSTYTYRNLSAATRFRVRLFSGSCTAYSPVVTINVTLSSLGGTVSGSHSVCPNKTFNLTLNNYRGQILYWQQSKNSGASWTNIACTSAKMPSSGITATTWFRAVVSNNSCTSAYSVPSDGTDNIGFKVTVGCSSSLVVNNDRTNQSQTAIEKTTIVDTDVETLNVNGQNNVHILRGGIKVYPNPASKEAWVDMAGFEGQQVTLTLTDILGKTIQQEVLTQVSATPHRLDVSNLPTGLYQIHIQAKGEQLLMKKLQVTK